MTPLLRNGQANIVQETFKNNQQRYYRPNMMCVRWCQCNALLSRSFTNCYAFSQQGSACCEQRNLYSFSYDRHSTSKQAVGDYTSWLYAIVGLVVQHSVPSHGIKTCCWLKDLFETIENNRKSVALRPKMMTNVGALFTWAGPKPKKSTRKEPLLKACVSSSEVHHPRPSFLPWGLLVASGWRPALRRQPPRRRDPRRRHLHKKNNPIKLKSDFLQIKITRVHIRNQHTRSHSAYYSYNKHDMFSSFPNFQICSACFFLIDIFI